MRERVCASWPVREPVQRGTAVNVCLCLATAVSSLSRSKRCGLKGTFPLFLSAISFTWYLPNMSWFRPATPGFLATLVATGLLAAVSFGVPWIKSVYFLKATVTGFDGSLTLGTLGYCLDNAGKLSCSKPSVGYEIGEHRPSLRRLTTVNDDRFLS